MDVSLLSFGARLADELGLCYSPWLTLHRNALGGSFQDHVVIGDHPVHSGRIPINFGAHLADGLGLD